MAEVIVFPDVEALLVSHLNAEYAARGYVDYKWSTRVPKNRPRRFGRIRRTGGVRQSLVADAAQITVEWWADKETDAIDDAQLGRGLIFAIDEVDGVQFYHVDEFSAPANLPDPDSGQVRYSATYAVRVRGSAL